MTNDQKDHERVSSDDAAVATGLSDRVPVGQTDRRQSEAEWGGSGKSLLGEMVGSIRIVDYIGQGGFGEVYTGYDEKLNRKVALKALRSDLRLKAEARARFLREARMLSQLDHPHICRIYDLIASKDRDFLVLELLTGTSLAKRIKKGCPRTLKFKIAEQVARALAAAHEKGIVHRDLKPDNVMITPDDEVKVLDFGLARPYIDPMASTLDVPSVGPDQGKRSADDGGGEFGAYAGTRLGAVMGTPGYMSPEQARGEPATPASDLYSLGLLVQELFSGRPPVGEHLTVGGAVARASRAESRPFVDRDRDLVALVSRLKSLAPASRPSALDAAERVQWISQKPRRLKLRRLAVGIAAVLLATTTVAVIQGLRANRAAARAEREAETAKQVAEFLVNIFKVSDPSEARGRTVTAREIMEEGAKKIGTELKDQPLVQARLMDTIGNVYWGLGLYKDAEPLLASALAIREKTLPPRSLDLADSLNNLANLYDDQGRHAEAEPLYKRALAVREEALGPNNPDVAASLNNLASLYDEQGKYAEAEPLHKRCLTILEKTLGPGHPDVAKSLNNLANLYLEQAKYAEAEPLYQRALAIREKTLGPDHPNVATSLNNLADLYCNQGKYAVAEPLVKRSLAIWEKVLGPDHPDVAISLITLTTIYVSQAKYAEAEPLVKRSLAIREKALGPDHPDVAQSLVNLAGLFLDQGKYAEAEPLLKRALAIDERAIGPRSRETADSLRALASCELRERRFNGALDHSVKSLEIGRELSAKTPEDQKARFFVGSALLLKGQIEAAMGKRAEGQSSWTEALSFLDPIARNGRGVTDQSTYAQLLLCSGRMDEARPIVKSLLNTGYKGPDLLALCDEKGLLPKGSVGGIKR